MGPLTFEARRMALSRILGMQAAVNADALAQARPLLDILDDEEVARIEALIAAGTWPEGWDGDEPGADQLLDKVFADGSVQPLLGLA